MINTSDIIREMLQECSVDDFDDKRKDYTVGIKIKLRIRDVEDQYEAQNYVEDFIGVGLNSITESDDEEDDHYRLESTSVDWSTFEEVEPDD